MTSSAVYFASGDDSRVSCVCSVRRGAPARDHVVSALIKTLRVCSLVCSDEPLCRGRLINWVCGTKIVDQDRGRAIARNI